METCSLRIEHLLCQIAPETKGMRVIVAKNPYTEILKVLTGRISTKKLEKLRVNYQGIEGECLANLQEENYDLEKLITDLINLIKGEAI